MAKRKKRVSAPRKRAIRPETRVKLKEALTLLRKHVRGYEASDGYTFKAIETFDATKRRRLIRRAAKLKELTNVPFDTVKAKTKKARTNLRHFTKQRIRGAKHFIVHKPSDNFKVRIRDDRVEVEGRFPRGVVTRSRFFLFPRTPRYPKELVAMARQLLKEMPAGFYSLITAAHGDTGEPFDKEAFIARLNEYLAAYEVDQEGRPTGFSEALVGVRFMSTTLGGAVTQRRQIDARRQAQRDHNKKKHVEAIRQERQRARVKRKPRKGK